MNDELLHKAHNLTKVLNLRKVVVHAPTTLAIFIAVIVFLIKFTPHVLNPSNFDWVMSYSDCSTEYVSWLFYRNIPWHFPIIGTLEGYDYPTVTGIGLTGAIPLLAVPFKIVSPFLPADFQYFGFWFLACYVLQAVFAVRLLRGVSAVYNFSIKPIQLVLGAVFFILSPALLTRSGHINLCAQWLILWSLCIYFENKTARPPFFSFLKIIAITALIHQYLLLMVLGLAFATYWKTEKIGRFSWIIKILMNAAGLVVAGILWYFVGNFNTSATQMTSVGFGLFSANLNTFFNGQGEQLLMPKFNINDGQYEGIGYLGAGLLAMVLTVFYYYLAGAKRGGARKISFSPLAFVAVLFALFAFSHILTFGHKTLFEGKFLLENPYFLFISQAFRSSGRFIWMPHYLLMAVVIVGFLKAFSNKRIVIYFLSGLTLLQIIDIAPMVTRERKYYNFKGYTPSVMTPKTWQQMTQEAERIVMLPPYIWHYKEYLDYIHFAHVAALNHQSITTGYLSRPDWEAHVAYEKKMFAALDKGALGDETQSVFIGSKTMVRKVQKIVKSGQARAFIFEDYVIAVPVKMEKTLKYLSELPNCVPAHFDTEGLAEFLKNNAHETILTVVKDDGAWKLCDEAKEQFRKMGSDISKLALHSGMVAIFQKGKLVFEKISPEKESVIQKFKKGETVKGYTFPKDLRLESAGGLAGNFGKIIFDGIDYSLSQRGFNLIVVDKDFNILKNAYFDTFDDCYSGEVKSEK